MQRDDFDIPGYTYGLLSVQASPISPAEFEQLKISVGMTAQDEQFLKLAGEVLADQTHQVVQHWRAGIIASIPNLARHSRSLDGTPLPQYLARSNGRFERWILDTCDRQYDQTWLDYQNEIALRHTSEKKNQIDHVQSTPYVPLRDIIAFSAVMNQTIKPYLAAKGHPPSDVDGMHAAWCKSMQLQLALWARVYTSTDRGQSEW